MKALRVGARNSVLSIAQTEGALAQLREVFPALSFELVPFDSPGDRDQQTDLRNAPQDFFTRDLDAAVLEGRIDFAVHSAKDLPDPLPPALDWFYLPGRADPRDCWVLRRGETLDRLKAPRIGVSSDRRAAYARACFPEAALASIRGAIPSRLAQLDRGDFDALLVAYAALERLGLTSRATRIIPLDELTPPETQGILAVTYACGNHEVNNLRARFVKAVRLVSAGVGSAGLCTRLGAEDLRTAEICLYDQLLDERLLELLPPTAQRIPVGKRCGAHSMKQPEITAELARLARTGRRVVRLKGGDAGLFGRLSEEVAELERLELPYVVRPGVSALSAATTGTGLLLTQRGVSRAFSVATPRAEDGSVSVPDPTLSNRVFFMSVKTLPQVVADLQQAGWPADAPAAIVYEAGGENEHIVRAPLGELHADESEESPGLVLVGPAARGGWKHTLGALHGARVLLTCSEALQAEAARAVEDLGGRPLRRPLIRLTPESTARAAVGTLSDYDAVVLTSPSAIRIFFDLVRDAGLDLRTLPRFWICGTGCAAELKRHGFAPDLMPTTDFSAAGLAAEIAKLDLRGRRVLRLRSAKAGSELAKALRAAHAEVDDHVLYRNEAIDHPEPLPDFDAVYFASASAVEVFAAKYGISALDGKSVVVMGKPTGAALRKLGRKEDVVAASATTRSAIESLASLTSARELLKDARA